MKTWIITTVIQLGNLYLLLYTDFYDYSLIARGFACIGLTLHLFAVVGMGVLYATIFIEHLKDKYRIWRRS